MDYSKSKTYSKIMWVVYIIIGMLAITYISRQEAKLKVPVIEDTAQSNVVTDISVTDEKENLTNIYMPIEHNDNTIKEDINIDNNTRTSLDKNK